MAGAPMGKGGTGGGSGYGYMPMQQPASPGMGKGGIGGLPDIRASLDAYKGYEPSAETKAFWAAHPGYASTTYAPGYQQNWENNFNAQQDRGNYYPGMGYLPEARNEIGPDFSDYFKGISLGEPPAIGFTPERGGQSQQGQQGQQQPPQNTGQQITDPETGRNFTVGDPMTRDYGTTLAYKRAMEAFNQSNQQNQQPGGQAQQVGQINPGAS
jgi:hypothetical protein